MRIVVTGATGFIGRHLVQRLVERNACVRALVRRPPVFPLPANVDVVPTAFDRRALAGSLQNGDLVVHLAGQVRARSAEEFTASNVTCTREIAAAAAAVGARLVHVSSLAAAGPASPDSPRSEADDPRPLTPYGVSKLAGERVVADTHALHWTILRPGVVYGPGDGALLTLIRMADHGVLPRLGTADAAYSFLYIDDMVRALEAAIDQPSVGRTLFVAHPCPVTTADLNEAIRRAIGRPVAQVAIPLPLLRLAASASEAIAAVSGRLLPLDRWRYEEIAAPGFVCRVDAMRDALGVEAAVGLGEGITRTVAWYRSELRRRARHPKL
jgi:nucleoside-diphosphate-sugar epimerase